MTIRQALLCIHGYPIPADIIERTAIKRGVRLEEEFTPAIATGSSPYNLSVADLLLWVSTAPNISEGGVSIDMPYSDRERLHTMARNIYAQWGESDLISDPKPEVTYGYKGSVL